MSTVMFLQKTCLYVCLEQLSSFCSSFSGWGVSSSFIAEPRFPSVYLPCSLILFGIQVSTGSFRCIINSSDDKESKVHLYFKWELAKLYFFCLSSESLWKLKFLQQALWFRLCFQWHNWLNVNQMCFEVRFQECTVNCFNSWFHDIFNIKTLYLKEN